jgi:hypothetical protein
MICSTSATNLTKGADAGVDNITRGITKLVVEAKTPKPPVKQQIPFPFMKLPREIRDKIYTYMHDDPEETKEWTIHSDKILHPCGRQGRQDFYAFIPAGFIGFFVAACEQLRIEMFSVLLAGNMFVCLDFDAIWTLLDILSPAPEGIHAITHLRFPWTISVIPRHNRIKETFKRLQECSGIREICINLRRATWPQEMAVYSGHICGAIELSKVKGLKTLCLQGINRFKHDQFSGSVFNVSPLTFETFAAWLRQEMINHELIGNGGRDLIDLSGDGWNPAGWKYIRTL